MNKQQWQQIWDLLGAAYPEAKLDEARMEAQLELYVRCLSDLPPMAIMAAVVQHIAGCKWFPKVAELRDLAVRLLPVGDIPTVTTAYAEVLARVADTGSYGMPGWSHPLIRKAVEAMGWRNICFSEEPDVCRSNFIRLYEIHANRQRQDAALLPEVRQVRRQLAGGEQVSLPDKIRRLSDKMSVTG